MRWFLVAALVVNILTTAGWAQDVNTPAEQTTTANADNTDLTNTVSDILPRLNAIVGQFYADNGLDQQQAGQVFYEDLAGLSEEVSTLLLPALEQFTDGDLDERNAQIDRVWPFVEFTVTVVAVIAENLDAYVSPDDEWKLASVRRMIRDARSVWSKTIPELFEPVASGEAERQLLTDLMFFWLLSIDSFDLEEIGQALMPNPDGDVKNLDASQTLRRDQVLLMLSDFGLEGLPGSYIAAAMVADDPALSETLDRLTSRLLILTARFWPDIQRASRDGDGEVLIGNLAKFVNDAGPVLGNGLQEIAGALKQVPDNAAKPETDTQASTSGTPENAATEAVPDPAPVPLALLPEATIAELRQSLAPEDGRNIHDDKIDEILARFSGGGQDDTLAVTLVYLAQTATDDRLSEAVLNVLARMDISVLTAEEVVRAFMAVPDLEQNKADLARIFLYAGVDLSVLAAGLVEKIEKGEISDFDKRDGLRLLGATGPSAIPRIPWFLELAVSPESYNRSAGLEILKGLVPKQYPRQSPAHELEYSQEAFESYYKAYFADNPDQATAIRARLEELVAEGPWNITHIWLLNEVGGDSEKVADALIALAEKVEDENLYRYLFPFSHLRLSDATASGAAGFLTGYLGHQDDNINYAAASALMLPHFSGHLAFQDVNALLQSNRVSVWSAGARIAGAHPELAGDLVNELAALLERPDADQGKLYPVYNAIEAAGDRAATVAEGLALKFVEADAENWSARRILEALGAEKAATALPVLEAAVADPGRAMAERIKVASLLDGMAGEETQRVIDLLASASPNDLKGISDALDWQVLQVLGNKSPLTQTNFEGLKVLVLDTTGSVQVQAIEALVNFLKRATGPNKEIWSAEAANFLLTLPPVERELVVVQAFATFKTDDLKAFERGLALAERELRDTISDPPGTDSERYVLFSEIQALAALAALEPDTGPDDRHTKAGAFFLAAIEALPNNRSAELLDKLGDLGRFEAPVENKVYQKLAALVESLPDDGPEPLPSRSTPYVAAEALIRIAANSPKFLQPVLNQIDTKYLGSKPEREKLQDILQSLAGADQSVLRAAVDPLAEFYLTPLGDKPDFMVRMTLAGATKPIAALGQASLPLFARFAKEKDTLESPYFDDLQTAVNATQDTFTGMTLGDLDSAVDQFQAIVSALAERRSQQENNLIPPYWEEANDTLARAISSARDKQVVIRANWLNWLKETLTTNPYLIAVVGYLSALLAVFLFSTIAPRWALGAYQLLSKFTLGNPKFLGIVQAPLFLKWILMNPRVLRAWTRRNAPKAADYFQNLPTVWERRIYYPLPVICNGEHLTERPLEELRGRIADVFRGKNIARFVIRGIGGSGKTSLACQLGLAALNESISGQKMIPVFIETEFASLEDAISATLKEMLDLRQNIEKPILHALLRSRQILVIVDHYSELDSKSRAAFDKEITSLDLNALIVTSRTDVSSLGAAETVEPMPISRTPALSAFLERYLTSAELKCTDDDGVPVEVSAIDFLADADLSEACAHLQRVSRPEGSTGSGKPNEERLEGDVTPLLAKIFAMQIVSRIQKRIEADGSIEKIDFSDLAPSVPSIYISYVEGLRHGAPSPESVKSDLEGLAWQSVGTHYSPRPIPVKEAHKAFDDQKLSQADKESRIAYYADKMGVLRKKQPGDIVDTLSFTHDAVSEYLAASWLVNSCGSDETKWREQLDRLDEKLEDPKTPRDFVQVLKLTAQAAQTSVDIPDGVKERIESLRS
ncbi:hypothetical protein LP7551_04408 [Roseibium album]|nr:hypothetical protein LP7551_04408 [Roseibium album]